MQSYPTLLYILFLLALPGFAVAQCPCIKSAMIDAYGPASNEGKNEFVVFVTGADSLALDSLNMGYGTTTAATNPTVDGRTAGIWSALPASPAITNAGGSITNLTSGKIPPFKPVILIPDYYTIEYDFSYFGPEVYVLCFDHLKAGAVWSSLGNFSNSGSSVRYFRITTPGCNKVVAYVPDSLIAYEGVRDGAGVMWDTLGNARYVNSGYHYIVLPLLLESFRASQAPGGSVLLQWETGHSGLNDSLKLERSCDGTVFQTIDGVKQDVEDNNPAFYIDTPGNCNGYAYYRITVASGGRSISTGIVGLALSPQKSYLTIAPNPFVNTITLRAAAGGIITRASIRSSDGSIVYTSGDTSLGAINIDATNWPPGFYWSEVHDGLNWHRQLLLKQ